MDHVVGSTSHRLKRALKRWMIHQEGFDLNEGCAICNVSHVLSPLIVDLNEVVHNRALSTSLLANEVLSVICHTGHSGSCRDVCR